jgi:hypothetical protein
VKLHFLKKPISVVHILAALGIILILVLILDPVSYVNRIENEKRLADAQTLVHALGTYETIRLRQGFGGLIRPGEQYYMIGNCSSGASSVCNAVAVEDTCVSFDFLVDEEYLLNIPQDSSIGTNEMSGYYYRYLTGEIFEVGACHVGSQELPPK